MSKKTFEKPTILVVDDNSRNRLMLASLLDHDYHVIAHGCPEHAESLIHEGKEAIDIILTKSGEIGNRLAAAVQKFKRDLVIILMVPDGQTLDDALVGSNANGFICDPIKKPVTLVSKLHSCLGLRTDAMLKAAAN